MHLTKGVILQVLKNKTISECSNVVSFKIFSCIFVETNFVSATQQKIEVQFLTSKLALKASPRCMNFSLKLNIKFITKVYSTFEHKCTGCLSVKITF